MANFLLRHSVVCDTGVELSDGRRRRGSIYRAWESLVSVCQCYPVLCLGGNVWGARLVGGGYHQVFKF